MKRRWERGGGRLGWAAAFWAVSLALLVWGIGRLPGPGGRAALAYMRAAVRCDYAGIYQALDPGALEWEAARDGLDEAAMARAAQVNSRTLTRLVRELEETYGVAVDFSYRLAGERELEGEALAALTARDAADGYLPETLEAWEARVRVSGRLTGRARRETMEEELTLTALHTPRGWGVARQDVHAFTDFLIRLDRFAWERFGLD